MSVVSSVKYIFADGKAFCMGYCTHIIKKSQLFSSSLLEWMLVVI